MQIAEAYSFLLPRMFSLEMWGGATFDTSMRFLKEDPWDRLDQMRSRCPNSGVKDMTTGNMPQRG